LAIGDRWLFQGEGKDTRADQPPNLIDLPAICLYYVLLKICRDSRSEKFAIHYNLRQKSAVSEGGFMSIDYIMIGSNDLARSRTFYDAVMPHIGGAIAHDYEGMTFGYALSGGVTVWIIRPNNGEAAAPANGSMPGFGCTSTAAVDAAYAAALANGGTDEGAPGPRPLYGSKFYGGYVRDPDGNKMSFVLAGTSPDDH
jgi:catechol 2,3-dioxygenase-like lactoylglutathione lyase family enzyme